MSRAHISGDPVLQLFSLRLKLQTLPLCHLIVTATIAFPTRHCWSLGVKLGEVLHTAVDLGEREEGREAGREAERDGGRERGRERGKMIMVEREREGGREREEETAQEKRTTRGEEEREVEDAWGQGGHRGKTEGERETRRVREREREGGRERDKEGEPKKWQRKSTPVQQSDPVFNTHIHTHMLFRLGTEEDCRERFYWMLFSAEASGRTPDSLGPMPAPPQRTHTHTHTHTHTYVH